MHIDSGFYIIRPKDDPKDYLATGPVPPPGWGRPIDMPVKVNVGFQRWRIESTGGDTANVTADEEGYVYKWFVTDNKDLFVTGIRNAGNFRFDLAGNNIYNIGIPNENLLLTLDRNVSPQLFFRPANGSDAQKFEVIRLEKK